ncbi:hypothetical protein ACQJBY_073596 [Aegilops geniculata]
MIWCSLTRRTNFQSGGPLCYGLVKFLDHPMGEGEQCPAKKKDLRPALDWSIIKGWTVPLSAAKGKSWQAAHLVHPKSDVQEERSSTDEDEALGSSSTVKTHSSDRNTVSKLRNQRMATHESSDPSRRRTRSSCGLLISPSEPATVEPNGNSGSRRYPFRVRRNAAEQQR